MEEIDLKELFEIFWSKKAQIILTVLIFMTIGAIYTIELIKPKYTSSTTLVLVQADSSNNKGNSESLTTSDLALNAKLVSTYSELIKSKNVVRQVISNLDIDVAEENLRKSITVNAVEDTELIKISVSNANPLYAEQMANEIANVFTEKVVEIYNLNNVYVVDKAEISTNPSNINHTKNIMIFSIVGTVIAFACTFISSMLDTTVKTADDVEKKIKVPVLASIPKYDFK